jgi:hypothetical protein
MHFCFSLKQLFVYIFFIYLYIKLVQTTQGKLQLAIFCSCHASDQFNVKAGGVKDTSIVVYTAKTQYNKFETNIPKKGTARIQSQFLHYASVSDLYISLIGLPILLQENRWTIPIVGIYINGSQIHESGNYRTEAAQFLFWEYITSNIFAVRPDSPGSFFSWNT